MKRFPERFRTLVVSVLVAGGSCLTALAFQDPETGQKTVKGNLYEVYVFDSGMDYVHSEGHWIKEVHVPGAGISFNTLGGLNVFKSDAGRYAAPKAMKAGDPEPSPLPDQPARKIRELELSREHVDLMLEILRLKEKGAPVAEAYCKTE